MRRFQGMESSSDWLVARMEELAMSQAQLGRLLDREPAQVHRWLHGRELIPRESLVEIAALDGTAAVNHVNGLKNCEEMASRLARECALLAQEIRLSSELLTDRMLDSVERRAIGGGSAASLFEQLTQYLAVAIFAVRTARRCFAEGEPLVTVEAIRHHLRYPANAFLAELLELGQSLRASEAPGSLVLELREQCLASLRQTAKIVRPKSAWHELCRQHAVHILARHGEESDQEYATVLLGTTDIELRRMAYYGLLLNKKDDEIIERFRAELRDDEGLARVTLAFDALHYGDSKLLNDGQLCAAPSYLDNTIMNLCRQLAVETHWGIRDLGAFKLYEILHSRGLQPFATPRVRDLLPALLDQLADLRSPEEARLAKQLKEVMAPNRRKAVLVSHGAHDQSHQPERR